MSADDQLQFFLNGKVISEQVNVGIATMVSIPLQNMDFVEGANQLQAVLWNGEGHQVSSLRFR